jgi:isopentenyl phosphate kinase
MRTTNKSMPDSNTQIQKLHFLKLGGSLITDKNHAHTHRPETLNRLAEEIAAARAEDAGLRLILGHGSGSFGHVVGKKFGTRQGVRNQSEWQGFAEVWWEAISLNRLVMDALHRAGLPAISFPPIASVIAHDAQVITWDLTPLSHALRAGLLPVVFGDVVFDLERGGTILSTEDLFAYLVRHLPQAAGLAAGRVLLAGIEAGVWDDFPSCNRLIGQITPESYAGLSVSLSGAQAADVTGGMASKVQHGLTLIQEIPGLEVWIFSGESPGTVGQALLGQQVGTVIHTGKHNPG